MTLIYSNFITQNMKKKNKFVNIFFDTEFTTAGMNSELISIGMVSENKNKLYLEFNFNKKFLTPWLKENVLTQLNGNKTNKISARKKIEKWMKKEAKGKKIRLISSGKEMDNLLLYSLWTSKKYGILCWRHTLPSQINHTSHIDISTLFEINKLNPEINKLQFSNIKQNLKEHNFY